MLTARLLNSDASLNNFFEITSLDFVAGSQIDLSLRLFDSQKSIRYVPPATASLKIFLQTGDIELEKTLSVISSDDRSMWKVTLTEDDTEEMLGGSVKFELDVAGDGTNIQKGIMLNALRRITVECN